ncbi:MAG: twin-arginine translocation signal domain-containing protein [Rhodospirillaceae bacterium]|nr:twin-arginine translocation signal domain-containing protein [Rhodospirillaceae bacterium]MBL6941792.1 twin-arginine translocation signal domain-containing protein [Rhodospirillales bacterium]
MMKQKTEIKQERLPRREFLKGAALSAGAAAVAAVGTAPKASEAAGAKPPSTGGYQETNHVRTYYSLARF